MDRMFRWAKESKPNVSAARDDRAQNPKQHIGVERALVRLVHHQARVAAAQSSNQRSSEHSACSTAGKPEQLMTIPGYRDSTLTPHHPQQCSPVTASTAGLLEADVLRMPALLTKAYRTAQAALRKPIMPRRAAQRRRRNPIASAEPLSERKL